MTREEFDEIWENLTTDDKVRVWNEYAIEQDPDNEIFENDEEFFNTFFEKPMDAVRAVFFGNYKYNDRYVWFNGYANLDTADFEDELPIYENELFDYIQEGHEDILEI